MAALRHIEVGDGPAIVLLHGLGGRAELWSQQLDPIADIGFRVLALDLRGHGASAGAFTARPWTVPELAQDVLDTLDDNGVQQFTLVGHSLGGRIAWAALSRWRHRIRSLVSVCAQCGPPQGPYLATMREWQAALGAHGSEAFADLFAAAGELPSYGEAGSVGREWFRSSVCDTDPMALAASIEAIVAMPDYTPLLPTVQAPVLAVLGSEDENFRTSFRRYADLLPDVTAAVVEDSGHYPMLEQPAAFTSALVSFLSRQPREEPAR